MRTIWLTLLLVPALAASARAEPDHYIAGGAMLGIDHAFDAVATLEGGERLGPGTWLHGILETGTSAGIDEATESGEYFAARAGLEWHIAIGTRDIVELVPGVDLGVRHYAYMADDDAASGISPVAIGRLGFDIGSRALRFRPGLEVSFDDQGFTGINANAALAYRW
ncbi:MAG TPA: hypothetical protein VLX92_02755 [Kofleriaceae bacterium]|nr:hypothetical protein [Kofleriaceae bacterium]